MTIRYLSLLPLLLAAALSLPAEDRGEAPPATLRAHGDLVLINATVVDRQDHLVTTLGAGQFRVLDERQEQPLRSLTLEDAPVSVVVVFDVSGSMKRENGQALEALDTFLKSLRPDDAVSLITFADRPVVAAGFTGDTDRIREASRAAKVGGGTSLVDAVALGFAESRRAKDGRRHALVVITDGGDRNSRTSWREIRRLAREANTRVYPFLLWSAADEFAFEQGELRGMAEDTGGRMFTVARSRRLPGEVEKLNLHQQYVLGFVPPSREKDGRYRHVTVELRDRPAHLRVFWKHGYQPPTD